MTDKNLKVPGVIVDVDGTLADVAPFRYLVENRPRDFEAFHSKGVTAGVITDVKNSVVSLSNNGLEILIVTSRQEKWRVATEKWLTDNQIPFSMVFMRSAGDFRADAEVKSEIYEEIRLKFNVVLAFDDNPAIIEVWKSFEIPTVVVPGWSPAINA